MLETQVLSLGQGRSPGEEMATHSSTLAWKIPWMEEPHRLQSMGRKRVGHNWATSLSLSFQSLLELTFFYSTFAILFFFTVLSKLKHLLPEDLCTYSFHSVLVFSYSVSTSLFQLLAFLIRGYARSITWWFAMKSQKEKPKRTPNFPWIFSTSLLHSLHQQMAMLSFLKTQLFHSCQG